MQKSMLSITKELKQIYKKFTKGAMQGPFGDIGRHGDSKTNIFTNLYKASNAGSQWDYLGDTGRHRDFEELLDDIGGLGDY